MMKKQKFYDVKKLIELFVFTQNFFARIFSINFKELCLEIDE